MADRASDLPKDFTLDEAAPFSEADDQGVEAFLHEIETMVAAPTSPEAAGMAIEPPETFLQDHSKAVIAATSDPEEPGVAKVVVNDPLDVIQSVIRQETGRGLGHYPAWIRFWREDLQRSFLIVLHSPSPHSEVEMVAVGHPGVLNRTTLRAALRWGFYACGWARVVARIPVEPRRKGSLSDYLARCRFQREGIARAGLPGLVDHEVWALTALDALWVLPRSQRKAAVPAQRIQPPTSREVH